MKDHLLKIASAETDRGRRLNVVREYLQALILRSLQDAGAFASLAFLGGTALRFLHGLPRYSEDLDFSVERRAHFKDLQSLLAPALRDLEAQGYEVEGMLRMPRVVQTSLVKFPGILAETGLSDMRSAKLSVRIEVDTQPPAGAVCETRLVTRHFPIGFRAYDLRSCLAGKLHALLARGHPKGRDLFDLSWYLTHPDRPEPNFALLSNALGQTGWKGPAVDTSSWREVLAGVVESLDWEAVRRDVDPFLEDARDRRLMDRDLLLAELRR